MPANDLLSGAKVLAIAFISSFVIILVALRFLPKFTPFQRLVLNTTEDVTDGFRSAPGEYESLLGKEGIALTLLRPAGTANIDGEKVSVVTEGDFIEQNSRIRVTKIEGYRIVVERV